MITTPEQHEDDSLEVIVMDGESRAKLWETCVFERFHHKCASCGSNDKLKALLIIPEEFGGKKTVENSKLLCRTCDLAAQLLKHRKMSASGEDTRPINFWIGRSLHGSLRNGFSRKYGFNSIASLVRFVMGRYVEQPDFFEDVESYVDRLSDVKVNVWVPRDLYDAFKHSVTSNGMTVTDSLRGLLRMYESESERIFRRVQP